MPRHEFSQKVKRAARERSGGFCEAIGEVYGLAPGQRCNAPLAGKRVEIDHYPLPATDKGSDTLENAVACCSDCHQHKTSAYDVPMQAKGKRVSDRHLGISKKPKWGGRGFAPRPKQHSATKPIRHHGDIHEDVE